MILSFFLESLYEVLRTVTVQNSFLSTNSGIALFFYSKILHIHIVLNNRDQRTSSRVQLILFIKCPLTLFGDRLAASQACCLQYRTLHVIGRNADQLHVTLADLRLADLPSLIVTSYESISDNTPAFESHLSEICEATSPFENAGRCRRDESTRYQLMGCTRPTDRTPSLTLLIRQGPRVYTSRLTERRSFHKR